MSDAAANARGLLFFDGSLTSLPPEARRHLLERAPADEPALTAQVAELVADVRGRGDAALLDMARRFDGVTLDAPEVPLTECQGALDALDPALRGALERAADNVRRFHQAQLPGEVTLEVEPGVRVTRRWAPLERVGVYAPGGRAAYPSSVLMGVVPAVAAGVAEVVVCSPPGPDGRPPQAVLAACALGGATRVFAVGGAGAVAALAFGTDTIPAVDAIVGPGNRWVTEAKRQVAGRVLIDSPAGPSEVLVLADAGADPALVAREVMAQAEHDPDAACVVVAAMAEGAVRDAWGDAFRQALAGQLADAPRRDVAAAALAGSGALLFADDVDAALDFTRAYAPEHLSLMVAAPEALARRIPTAGTIFVGPWASVAFGDYITGANHVLPTAGRARSFSGLSTQHFIRSYTVQEITAGGAAALADDVARLAEAEGLPAHAAAALARSAS